MAIEWLDYISKKDNIIIKHALNEGEFTILNLKQMDIVTKQILFMNLMEIIGMEI